MHSGIVHTRLAAVSWEVVYAEIVQTFLLLHGV